MSNDPLSPLATLTCELQRAFAAEVSAGAPAVWLELRQHFRRQTGVTSDAEFADAAAQAVICGCFGLQSFASRFENTDAVAWLVDGTDPLVRHILLLCRDGGAAQQHSPAVRCTIEKIVRALKQEFIQAVHVPPNGHYGIDRRRLSCKRHMPYKRRSLLLRTVPCRL